MWSMDWAISVRVYVGPQVSKTMPRFTRRQLWKILVVEYCWTKTEFYRAIRRSVCVTIFQAMYIIVAAVTAIFFHIVVFAVSHLASFYG